MGAPVNTHWTVTRFGSWWDVRRPTGQREATYPLGQWQAAVAHAHIAASRQRIRDHKHGELFDAPRAELNPQLQRFNDWWKRVADEMGRQSNYVLAN